MQLQENILFANRYQLLRLLGRGGFSEVWLAEDNKTRLKVAVKIYVPGTGLDDDGIELFSREYSLVFNLNHANLLKPAHYDVYDRMPYLVMTYCERGSVNTLTGKISEDEIWKIINDVSSGLAHLHSLNAPVIHQDIKPGNILIDASGHYLISDFGISTKVRCTLRRSMPNPQSSGGGTLAYMGPERFSDNPAPIMASDIWALGATLFELMTGIPLFGDHGGLLQKGGADIPAITDSWSDNLKKLVRQCLSKETWDRPTAEKLQKWARQYFSGKTVQFDNKKPPCLNKKSQPEPVNTTVPNKSKAWSVSSIIAFFLVCTFIIVVVGIIYQNSVNINLRQNPVKRNELVVEYKIEAERKYRKLAEQGNAIAQNDLGLCYYNGEKGVAKNYYEAVKWYHKSAEQGNANAKYNLGGCYYYGNGLTQDYYNAARWYQKAADQGHADAQYMLGTCYANGEGVSHSNYEAARLYHKSAEQGNHNAQFSLGFYYYKGLGVPEDQTEAVKWYHKAAEQGNYEAQVNLGFYYYYRKNYSEAVKWIRKVADQGDASSQNDLGDCYYYGNGVPQDYYEAIKWYRKAADQGDSYAQNSLGMCYENSLGVTMDKSIALKYYKQASDNGNTAATASYERLFVEIILEKSQ